ncbi:MAG: ECF transporter S component [Erysipelotrichaceae bacterium]
MKNNVIKEMILTALFIALGIVLPMAFHFIGSGSVLLPMHIPVIIAGFVLSLPYAIIVAAVTPVLSSVLTMMPPVFPVLPFMFFELIAYGVVANILYRRLKKNVYVSLIASMIVGRIVSGIAVYFLVTFFMAKLPSPWIFVSGSFLTGLPGIVIQLIVIPVLVKILEKGKVIESRGVVVE